MTYYRYFSLLWVGFSAIYGFGQSGFTVQPVVNIQLWAAYTSDHKLYDDAQGEYVPVGNRLNFQMHRSRIGLKGDVNKRLKYLFFRSG